MDWSDLLAGEGKATRHRVYCQPNVTETPFLELRGGQNDGAPDGLFEKVPFIYGSGVIPKRFEAFKRGIKRLVIEEFFTREHIEKILNENNTLLSKNIRSYQKMF